MVGVAVGVAVVVAVAVGVVVAVAVAVGVAVAVAVRGTEMIFDRRPVAAAGPVGCRKGDVR